MRIHSLIHSDAHPRGALIVEYSIDDAMTSGDTSLEGHATYAWFSIRDITHAGGFSFDYPGDITLYLTPEEAITACARFPDIGAGTVAKEAPSFHAAVNAIMNELGGAPTEYVIVEQDIARARAMMRFNANDASRITDCIMRETVNAYYYAICGGDIQWGSIYTLFDNESGLLSIYYQAHPQR